MSVPVIRIAVGFAAALKIHEGATADAVILLGVVALMHLCDAVWDNARARAKQNDLRDTYPPPGPRPVA